MMSHQADGGCPLGHGELPSSEFSAYLADDLLLSLQRPRTSSSAEPSFLIISQVMELLFKLAHTEIITARDALERDDLTHALWTLRRLRPVYGTLTSAWDILARLSPVEYAEFRGELADGSGIQSHMYRRLEFALGNRRRSWVEAHRDNEAAHRELLRALDEPSLYDAALRLLWRRGMPVPKTSVERDWSQPYSEQEAVVKVWESVYGQYRTKRNDLFQLAEALVDVAYDFGRWRASHLLTVERLLGSKTGTGGTTGVEWLRRVAEHRFFPELWSVRAAL